MIDFKENIKIEDRYGTWYEIDRVKASDGKEYILFESEQYGDETAAILCVIPKDNQVRKVRGKKTGKEFIQIPKEFEVEETYDDIETALEQDLGLDILVEEACVKECNEALDAENISDEEVVEILGFFDRQKRLWYNFPDIHRDYFISNGNYVVELPLIDAACVSDVKESLEDLCQQLDLRFFCEENPEEYKIRYTFYPLLSENDDITEDYIERDNLEFDFDVDSMVFTPDNESYITYTIYRKDMDDGNDENYYILVKVSGPDADYLQFDVYNPLFDDEAEGYLEDCKWQDNVAKALRDFISYEFYSYQDESRSLSSQEAARILGVSVDALNDFVNARVLKDAIRKYKKLPSEIDDWEDFYYKD